MITPGSPYWVAPRTMNSIAINVLPQPAPPQIKVGLPAGRPPRVITSRPWMPVGHFPMGKRDEAAIAFSHQMRFQWNGFPVPIPP